MKKAYPAIFRKEESGCFVDFPDLFCVTEGNNLEEAVLMAGDVLNFCFGEGSLVIPLSSIEEN